ncbi:4-aminobutyrate--2-oxoglutarate transaminase [Burkholderia seminalis]|uniref:4-aminobutyrate--2-oxoglutarate transaminase n=1 Tax=Burkholderia TaxID=32008 RepID=UPI000668BDC8|nr:4-aminobutyrate--2-oxoglutarate transaminase [Burkholderia seminalis]AOJ29545.1 4-aminobutyrate aminotransferase [Burkholderia seminalis]KVF46463.1 4-aminobutyrate aminotransferase [Burkholderia seminalis]MBJ9589137.1 4-aminobutyrate--2-oxoglutarate transaminase [Burkholderia seminalis]MBJ9966556.1 4-aminobutyrate--2-oxoglutarate transaminase [Burkholderia seminalis]MCA7954836.1 4-aminobutyrate--2-oxoglutarate transaminase [Burkholderia seminalis]
MTVKNADLQARKNAATPRGVGVMCDFYAARAENAELWDVEGRRFIDFAAGIAVLNTGHRHPKIVKAISDQLNSFTHTAYQIVPYASYVELAEKINDRAPGDFPKKTAFFTTGAEAVENAIKIARAATGRPGVIAFSGGFHGRTMMGMALTGKVAPYKLNFGPFPGDVFHAPYPNALHGVTTADSIKAIEMLFKADIDPKRVAAIIFEPVQGEGGFNPAPAEFVRALRKICNEHGILLIADEVQTGFARTGKLFAMQHYDVLADLITMAKSLAGGMPLSGVVGRADVMDAAAPGGLGGTYAGNPLAVASAHAVLEIIDEEKLCERATQLGDVLKAKLTSLQADVPQIADVRGPGAMIAVEFLKPGSGEPDAEFTKRVQTRALERGLLLLVCGVYSNVVRFLFPLTITQPVFDEALAILEEVLKETVGVPA